MPLYHCACGYHENATLEAEGFAQAAEHYLRSLVAPPVGRSEYVVVADAATGETHVFDARCRNTLQVELKWLRVPTEVPSMAMRWHYVLGNGSDTTFLVFHDHDAEPAVTVHDSLWRPYVPPPVVAHEPAAVKLVFAEPPPPSSVHVVLHKR